MSFDWQQAQQLKLQLGVFKADEPYKASAEGAAYQLFFGLDKIAAARYACGFYHPKGALKKWAQLCAHYWRCDVQKLAQTASFGTVCLAPGLFDHAGLFVPLIKFCLAQGYDVVCLEMPGHGLSAGQYCAIDSFFTYAALWEAFLLQHALYLQPPFVGLGQSTGCTGLTALALNKACPLRAAIFFSPLVRPQHWLKVKTTYFALGDFMHKVARNQRTNSHQQEFNDLLARDPLQAKFLAIQWVRALMAWVDALDDWPDGPSNFPLWIFQGSGDEVVDFQWNLECLQARFANAQVQFIEGAKHHLANESEPFTQNLWPAVATILRQIRTTT